jgi:hypothetical protein
VVARQLGIVADLVGSKLGYVVRRSRSRVAIVCSMTGKGASIYSAARGDLGVSWH